MSSIQVPILPITNIRPHSNPEVERLEVATVAGWQLCVNKGKYQVGDRVVYFEQGTTIPRELADALGVTNYLSEKVNINGERELVIHRIKLKGEPSFGLAIDVPDVMQDFPDNTNVAEFFGASKHYPPVRATVGDAECDHPLFPRYTDIENMRSYPAVLSDGEEVIATEKIHGTNVRIGIIQEQGEYVRMAGSRTLRRKQPETDFRHNIYWFPFSIDAVDSAIAALALGGARQVVLYGEVFGPKVQSYDYGTKGLSFRAFDLMIDGVFIDAALFVQWCEANAIDYAPILYKGPFSINAIQNVSNGVSIVGGSHGREGVVVRPWTERDDPAIGRVILKYVGDDYLFGKSAKNDTTDV